MLIGVIVWFDQYRLGYEFRISDLVDDRIHHEKIARFGEVLILLADCIDQVHRAEHVPLFFEFCIPR